MANSVYDFKEKTIGGKEVSLSDYSGKVILIVNTASKCGFTPQFDGLEKLYQEYKDQGLTILGFPCNQFKEQDPGSNGEIAEFCKVNYGVTFPMFSKIDVNGPSADPLYVYLKSKKSFAGFDPSHEITPILEDILGKEKPDYKTSSDIVWNFTKFLVDRSGNVVERFEPTTTPEALESAVKALL